MFFDDELISYIENNPIDGLMKVIKMTRNNLSTLSTNQEHWNEEEHEFLWEACIFIDLVLTNSGISIDSSLPKPTNDIKINCDELSSYITIMEEKFKRDAFMIRLETHKNKYSLKFSSSFAYEFSQGDLDRIQVLVNELRKLISNSKQFEEKHKDRLLKRLESLQAEIHKKVSDLDKFWGLIGDAGVIMGKLGTDAKPFVDRIRELSSIVWKTQARAEELPSNSLIPLLKDLAED